ncbi:MAG TPA: hypothetical protein VGQ52_06170 [Gemmatimonadaceae bacterium]|jgi:hypothetical protein|nr:hypothetical protein [Gemmatimonadaceae bacterium]
MSDIAPKVNVPAIAARITAKTALGMVPGIGPLLVAVVDEITPVVHAERLQGFAEELHHRVLDLASETLAARMREPDRYKLLEDGLRQAARASSRDRISHIANIIANGLTASEARAEDRGYLLKLLDELNDVEVLILCAHSRDTMLSAKEFHERHSEALRREYPTYGDPPELLDRDSIRGNYEQHLVRLGLLEEIYHAPYRKPLALDRYGKPEGIHRELSHLGRYLLREIGLPADVD